MRVAYFVHDLSDAAVAKRVRMLKDAGVDVVLSGFRRTPAPVPDVAGVPAFDLGRTKDARLLARAGSVAGALLRAGGWSKRLAGVDVVIGRNLEALALAALARRLHAPRARLAYECLDVHRLMLNPGPAGRAIRAVERRLMAVSDLLIVSSSAFISEYFEPFQKVVSAAHPATLLVENKAFAPAEPSAFRRAPRPRHGPPWRIGWFGMIRCRRSLDLLVDLAGRRPDLVQIDIRGRPSYTEFDDFDGQTRSHPNVVFGGPYGPDDLADMYGAVHFNWAVDHFQDEGNSRWLLPNRLYEGGRFGAPAIARRDCETGRWLERHGLGLVFEDPLTELEGFLDALSPEAYAEIAQRHADAPLGDFVIGPQDRQDLVRALAGDALDGGATSPGRSATSLRSAAE